MSSLKAGELVNFILKSVLDQFALTERELLSKDLRGEVADARKVYIYLLKKHVGLKLEHIGKLVNRPSNQISQYIKEFEAMDENFNKQLIASYLTIDKKISHFKLLNNAEEKERKEEKGTGQGE